MEEWTNVNPTSVKLNIKFKQINTTLAYVVIIFLRTYLNIELQPNKVEPMRMGSTRKLFILVRSTFVSSFPTV